MFFSSSVKIERDYFREIERSREIMERKAKLGEDFGYPLHKGDIIEGKTREGSFRGKVVEIEGIRAWIKRDDGKTNASGMMKGGLWAISRANGSGQWLSHTFYLGPEPDFEPIRVIECNHKIEKKKIDPLERIADALEVGKMM